MTTHHIVGFVLGFVTATAICVAVMDIMLTSIDNARQAQAAMNRDKWAQCVDYNHRFAYYAERAGLDSCIWLRESALGLTAEIRAVP